MAATKKAAAPRAVTQAIPATPGTTAQWVVASVMGLVGSILAAITMFVPRNIADVHTGFGSWIISFVWFLLLVTLGLIVGGGFGWNVSNRNQSGATINVRRRLGNIAAPMTWTWSRLRWSRLRGQSLTRWAQRAWLLLGLLLGFYAGMLNRHWVNDVDNGIFRFAAKLGLVLAGMFIGYLVFAWVAKKVIGVINKVTPQTPAQPGPTP